MSIFEIQIFGNALLTTVWAKVFDMSFKNMFFAIYTCQEFCCHLMKDKICNVPIYELGCCN